MWRSVGDVLGRVVQDVVGTFVADWPYLLLSVLAAAALTVYVGTDRLARGLRRRRWTGITGAVLLATLTPFCSCGTTAVVLGMLATEVPWAPIVTFMVASPLTSPSELLLSAGLFGWAFALVYFVGATALGFGAGGVTGWLEDRGWLSGQARMQPLADSGGCDDACGDSCGSTSTAGSGGSGPAAARLDVLERTQTRAAPNVLTRWQLRRYGEECLRLGRRIGLYFLAYSVIGYLVVEALPTSGLVAWLGDNPISGVPAAALLGVPVYITSEASLPMVAALMHGGLGAGPAMAFLVSGAGTSIGAISGALLIARRRVVGLVVGLLLAGAIILGWIAALTLSR